MSTPSVLVKAVDMPEDMKEDAMSVAKDAIEVSPEEKEIAGYIKKEFDQLHGGSWHCVVGRNFGSFVTHEPQRFIYMYVAKVAILLFKTP